MANVKRLKRKLLRQAIQDNVETLQGIPAHRRQRPWKSLWARRSLLFLAPLIAIGGSSYVVSRAVANDDLVVITQVVEALPAAAKTVAAGAGISLARPGRIDPSDLNLGVRRIVLDPGHGGENSGTVAPGGMMEKEITLDISGRLKRLLERDSFEVLMTRDADEAIGLGERTQYANDQRGDIFVSIHVNWIETRQVRGVETFFLGPTDDPELKRIAAAENKGSSYSLADFRSLLEGLYQDVRQDESRRLAESVQTDLYHSLRALTPQLQNRGVKTAPFVVLVSSQMPAILVEVSCLSNEEEVRLLTKPYYRQYIAQALFRGIQRYAASLQPTERPSPREEMS
jgi:N-acetylmuramoyl-L-alanine amidase